uniref:PLAT domain-containing protein n=1 Tax=Cairina moschata TaxID=8855 RepID=A0A8C3GM13_CAIMO
MPGDFLVTLYTGSRWGAGTKADIFLQLIGQNGTSDVHCLRHPQVPSFHQGSTDRFLLTTREGLGDICTFRVWHNNRGPSPGWFLSRAKVENMSTQKTWIFLCRKWHSLNRGDGWQVWVEGTEETCFQPHGFVSSPVATGFTSTAAASKLLSRLPIEAGENQLVKNHLRKLNTRKINTCSLTEE